jgi:hypothetical protein
MADPTTSVAADPTVRAFQVSVSDEELADFRRRVSAMRWPTHERSGPCAEKELL